MEINLFNVSIEDGPVLAAVAEALNRFNANPIKPIDTPQKNADVLLSKTSDDAASTKEDSGTFAISDKPSRAPDPLPEHEPPTDTADDANEPDGVPAPEPEAQSAPEQASANPGVSLEEVRAHLAVFSQAGKPVIGKELIEKHGGKKLSDVDPSSFPALLQDAKDRIVAENLKLPGDSK